MNITTIVDRQVVEDIFITAMEGGVNYWCAPVKINRDFVGQSYVDAFMSGNDVDVIAYEGDERAVVSVTNFAVGIVKAAEHYGLTVDRFYDEHDAEYADVAFQYAAFGEVIYG